MDYTPNQYDNDYARHVKREQELQAQRDARQEADMRSSRISGGRLSDNHEGLARLLAVVTGGGVWFWMGLESPATDPMERLLPAFVSSVAALWFFKKTRRLTRLISLVLIIGAMLAGISIIWLR